MSRSLRLIEIFGAAIFDGCGHPHATTPFAAQSYDSWAEPSDQRGLGAGTRGRDPTIEARWLRRVLEAARARAGLPALGAVVTSTDAILALAVTGVRRQGEATPVTVDDRWQLGSITKTFTALLIDDLVKEGAITWDTPLAKIFADLELSSAMSQVTLRELAEHRGGLLRDPDSAWVPTTPGLSLVERRRVLASIASCSIRPLEPGIDARWVE